MISLKIWLRHWTKFDYKQRIKTNNLRNFACDMRNFILADNQELTRFALENLLQQDETAVVYRAFDKAGLVALLKEHESAIVILDYTLFDFTDEDQLLIVAERFALSQWVLLSDELTLCKPPVVITDISASVRWRLLSVSSRRRTSNPVC